MSQREDVARQIARMLREVFDYIGGPLNRDTVAADRIIASHIAPLQSALASVTAERDKLKHTNEVIAAGFHRVSAERDAAEALIAEAREVLVRGLERYDHSHWNHDELAQAARALLAKLTEART